MTNTEDTRIVKIKGRVTNPIIIQEKILTKLLKFH